MASHNVDKMVPNLLAELINEPEHMSVVSWIMKDKYGGDLYKTVTKPILASR